MDSKNTLTYLEYKLFSLKNYRKSIKKSQIGSFVNINDINNRQNELPSMFTNTDLKSFIKTLIVDDKLDIGKIKEIAKRCGIDPIPLLSIFSISKRESISKEEFLDFLKYFTE